MPFLPLGGTSAASLWANSTGTQRRQSKRSRACTLESADLRTGANAEGNPAGD
jgi:hypothetical protein